MRAARGWTALWLAGFAALGGACAQRAREVERAAAPSAERAEQRDPAGAPAFFAELAARARALAEQPARPAPQLQLPAELESLDYDGYRKIRFRPEHSLWRGEPGRFEVQFFHPGPLYRTPVFISVLEHGRATPLPFRQDWFRYDGLAQPPPAQGLQFTGLRVHAPLNRDDYRDEVVAFHGASYFRAVGKGNVYGVSARGLAIDMGSSRPEEFPVFSHFFLQRPAARDESLWLAALLESRRATGAFAFRVRPGSPTEIEVTAALFARSAQLELGLAPLSSMFLSGENCPSRSADFRPEVHDSDGLALWSASGERLFRPLRNPVRAVTSSFRLDAPRGFGLVQRDRDFDHYQDLEARYQDRPGVWVEPLAGFEQGSLHLLELPAETEFADNIALAWVPERTPALPAELRVRYRLHIGSAPEPGGDAGRALATRTVPSQHGRRFLVDFLVPDAAHHPDVQAVISCSSGRVVEQHVEPNPLAGALRASFEVAPEPGAGDLELRAFLRAGEHTLTETWSYAWQAR